MLSNLMAKMESQTNQIWGELLDEFMEDDRKVSSSLKSVIALLDDISAAFVEDDNDSTDDIKFVIRVLCYFGMKMQILKIMSMEDEDRDG